MGVGARWGSGGSDGGQGADGGEVISKHPLGTVWHETTLTSHQSGIIRSLIFSFISSNVPFC